MAKAVSSEAVAGASWSQLAKESEVTSDVPQEPSHNFPCRKDFTFYPFDAASMDRTASVFTAQLVN